MRRPAVLSRTHNRCLKRIRLSSWHDVWLPKELSGTAAGASKAKELTHLLYAISACFQASGHSTPVLLAFGGRVAGRYSPIEFSGIESGWSASCGGSTTS